MAIQVGGTTVIDNSRNVVDVLGISPLGYSGLSSATSNSIGTGSRSFTTNQSNTAVAYQVGDRILISATGSISGTTQGTNVGTGAPIFKSKTGNTLQFRSILGSGGTNVSQVGDEVIMIQWTENPVIITIKNQKIADAYRRYFNYLWKDAKPA